MFAPQPRKGRRGIEHVCAPAAQRPTGNRASLSPSDRAALEQYIAPATLKRRRWSNILLQRRSSASRWSNILLQRLWAKSPTGDRACLRPSRAEADGESSIFESQRQPAPEQSMAPATPQRRGGVRAIYCSSDARRRRRSNILLQRLWAKRRRWSNILPPAPVVGAIPAALEQYTVYCSSAGSVGAIGPRP